MKKFIVTLLFAQPGIASYGQDDLRLSGDTFVSEVQRDILAESAGQALHKFFRQVALECGETVIVDGANAYHMSQMVKCHATEAK
jgi:hypothetical protein